MHSAVRPDGQSRAEYLYIQILTVSGRKLLSEWFNIFKLTVSFSKGGVPYRYRGRNVYEALQSDFK
jgi:hypothetical protein